ncbi:hypothetical protein M0805_001818 [Coniferiporia weirii]|nr:hypothetical protein M0805_001818 [Coniferiporia weirii]
MYKSSKSTDDNVIEIEDNEPALTVETVHQTYLEAWNEFYTWEQVASRQDIASLHRTFHESQDPSEDAHELPIANREHYICTEPEIESSRDESRVTFMHPDRLLEVVVSNKTYSAPELTPCPIYESCTPSTLNMALHSHQRQAGELLKFFPYIDDEKVDLETLADMYHRFSWESRTLGPDVEQIQLETARRLLNNTEATIRDIDGLDTMLPKLREGDKSGLLWRNTQRDPLPWGGMVLREEADDPLATLYKKECQKRVEDESGRLELHNKAFCPNLNCIVSHCRSHADSAPFNPARVDATLTSDQLSSAEGQACGEKCFRVVIVEDLDDVIWDNNTLDKLRAVLTVCPDVSPCKLVFACRMPCYEIFVQRQKLIIDGDIIARSSITTSISEPPPKARIFGKVELGTAFTADAHAGVIFHVYSGGRGASADKVTPTCVNSAMQHGRTKRIKVAPAKYGFGAFLTEPVKKHEFIAEYIGEIIPEDDNTDVRDFHMKYRNRNYAFALGSSVSDHTLDAMCISNETRFPNHESDVDKLNCYAKVLTVNDQDRIALFSTRYIRPGKELLFDYGETFFTKK